MSARKELDVYLDGERVGTLAQTKNGLVAFAYADGWRVNGFAISPFSLPLRGEVFVPSKWYFGGLFGVFADSLPDAWGRLLLDRTLRKMGVDVGELTMLDRLAYVGDGGMGALEYRPAYDKSFSMTGMDYDAIADACAKILQSHETTELETVYRLAGSSGGSRPKILVSVDGRDWMVKFPMHTDTAEVGKMEYDYALCAKACGIEMTEVRLFASAHGAGYFGTVRFDRDRTPNGSGRIHTLTAAGILELDFTVPSLDYRELFKLVAVLTREDDAAREQMFRRMCFNVFAHNRDDHAKNFSFCYDRTAGEWRLTPAYDLTYSTTYYGEHTTSVAGNGASPGEEDLLAVGTAAGMKKQRCAAIVRDIRERVAAELADYIKEG